MVSKVKSIGLFGIDGFLVEIEADVSRGMPSFEIVGLPDASVKESKERVLSAIRNCGFKMPTVKIVINLAPADVKKEGSVFDLAILLGVLKSAELINVDLGDCIFAGELSLSGEIKETTGILPMVITAKELGFKKVFVPEGNGNEAAAVTGIDIYPCSSVEAIIKHLSGEAPISVLSPCEEEDESDTRALADFLDVCGQEIPKRAIEIAAAGGHNILLIGSPGAGKSMLAKRIPTILPPMTQKERIETTKVHSIAGCLPNRTSLLKTRPFRAPHHTVSAIGLSGGGRIPKPGELSLAHNGVLFLDELAEFPKNHLEVLRQPLEDGTVTISRASGTITYPCEIMLICAMNPCKCGYYGHPTKPCTCSQAAVNSYLSRVSGPLLDRLDIHIEVAPVKYDELRQKGSESSEEIRKRVTSARLLQQQRYKDTSINCNARLTPAMQSEYCHLDDAAESFLRVAFDKLGMSARGYDRVLKVARTIADLAGKENIEIEHLAEAVQYRSLDKKYWNAN